MAKQVYSYTFIQPQIGGGGFQDNIFQINDPGRNLKIKSVLFDWRTELTVAPRSKYIGTAPPIDLWNYLELGTPLAQPKKFNRNLVLLAGLGTAINNNLVFFINQPGQYHFDSFFINETLGLRHYQSCSVGSANIYLTTVTIVIELETETNFIE